MAPSKTLTCGPPPAPAPVMTSGTPSPLTSAVATWTPPVNVAVVGEELHLERAVGVVEPDPRLAGRGRDGQGVTVPPRRRRRRRRRRHGDRRRRTATCRRSSSSVAVATTNCPAGTVGASTLKDGIAGRVGRHRGGADQCLALAVAPGVGAAFGAAEDLDAELRVRRAVSVPVDLRAGRRTGGDRGDDRLILAAVAAGVGVAGIVRVEAAVEQDADAVVVHRVALDRVAGAADDLHGVALEGDQVAGPGGGSADRVLAVRDCPAGAEPGDDDAADRHGRRPVGQGVGAGRVGADVSCPGPCCRSRAGWRCRRRRRGCRR